MGVSLRGTATKKRHGRGWRKARDRGNARWAERKAASATYCRGASAEAPTPVAARPAARVARARDRG
jgi:hypothetical protein